MTVCENQAVTCKLVDIWRRDQLGSIGADIAISHVVSINNNDVRHLRRGRRCCSHANDDRNKQGRGPTTFATMPGRGTASTITFHCASSTACLMQHRQRPSYRVAIYPAIGCLLWAPLIRKTPLPLIHTSDRPLTGSHDHFLISQATTYNECTLLQ